MNVGFLWKGWFSAFPFLVYVFKTPNFSVIITLTISSKVQNVVFLNILILKWFKNYRGVRARKVERKPAEVLHYPGILKHIFPISKDILLRNHRAAFKIRKLILIHYPIQPRDPTWSLLIYPIMFFITEGSNPGSQAELSFQFLSSWYVSSFLWLSWLWNLKITGKLFYKMCITVGF